MAWKSDLVRWKNSTLSDAAYKEIKIETARAIVGRMNSYVTPPEVDKGHGRVRHVADDRYFHLVPPVVHVAPPQRRYDRSHDSKSANDCIDIAIKVLSTISAGNLSDARSRLYQCRTLR